MAPRSFLEQKASSLSHRPLIVGTLTDESPTATRLARRLDLDLIEVRLDAFSATTAPLPSSSLFVRSLLSRLRRSTGKPLLVTLRAARERGHSQGPLFSDSHRERLLLAALPFAALVDVEIRSTALARRLTPVARRQGVGVIHSYHDFKRVGPLGTLDRWARLSEKLKGDIFKVAVTPATNNELEEFLLWGRRRTRPYRTLIGMGPVGLPSRTVGFALGSILTYGHLGQSTAPGQMAAADLVRAIKTLYPKARAA